MAENLCNNPKAVITARGLNLDKPCGLWEKYGLGWCSKKDYNDWLALYGKTINIAEEQFLYLKQVKIKKGNVNYTPEQTSILDFIEISRLNYTNLQNQVLKEKSLKSDTYEKRIADLGVEIQKLDCAIESIQKNIEEFEYPLKPTGLIEGSRESNIGKYFIYGLIGIGGIWAIKNL